MVVEENASTEIVFIPDLKLPEFFISEWLLRAKLVTISL
jgi:hypothetical protein